MIGLFGSGMFFVDQAKPRPVASPCVSICCLDEQDICTGCHRSADEISRWAWLDNEEKREVLRRCVQRARDAGNWL